MELTALSLGAKIQRKEVSVQEAVQASLAAIKEKDARLHAFLTVDEKGALLRAQRVQEQIDAGLLKSPLAGVPYAVKDNICTKGLRTTCGSRMLENYVPTYDATVIEKLEKAGAILIGKTNMDEFAMGSTTETSYYGPTCNPRNTAYVPGGSSGGSAAAVAAGMVPFALGSDTGGSIRQPSAFCGVTGIKPTYGTVSRYGLVAYASSLEQIGPIARSVSDCKAILQVIKGKEDKCTDATLLSEEILAANEAKAPTKLQGLRVGIPIEYQGMEDAVSQAVQLVARTLTQLGACVETCSLKLTDKLIPTYYLIACAEASSNLARFDGVKYGYRSPAYENLATMYANTLAEGFGKEVQSRIQLGKYVLSKGYYDAYYKKAMQVRTLIKKEYDQAFTKYDVLLTPTAPTCAPLLGTSLVTDDDKATLRMYQNDVCNVAANLCGLPAISIPCGVKEGGLPIGIQLMGNCFAENTLYTVAQAIEQKGAIEYL